jgi:hypothetical protein
VNPQTESSLEHKKLKFCFRWSYLTPINVSAVGFEILTAVSMKSTIFWDITPCSLLDVNDVSEKNVAFSFRDEEYAKRRNNMNQRYFLASYFMRFSFFVSSTLKMEATYSPETSVDFRLARRCNIVEDISLQMPLLFYCQLRLYLAQMFLLLSR